MKIGIVGGSIAGCSAAILLLKEGHQVDVFERSKKDLEGRGGGIGTTGALFEEIIEAGLINEGFAGLQINEMPFVGKSEALEPNGKEAWSMPMDFKVFQWLELWKNLRRNVPDAHYHKGKKITGAEQAGNGEVVLCLENGDKPHFDLVLFADGYNSLGRQILFPDKKLKYRGYVLWRGLLPESDIKNEYPPDNRILRLSYKKEPGHTVMYFIPNKEGSSKEGERVYNWASYVTIPEKQLDQYMTDKKGIVRKGTLPPGSMRIQNETRLKNRLLEQIPAYYASILNKTTDSYIQVIYTLDLDHYYKDHMCLIGDAGMVIQPFTGSGVFKGYNNVRDLITYMKNKDNLETALATWSKQQIQTGKRLFALGEQMEKAFIWDQPDFSKSDESAIEKWWTDSVSFPENFNFQKTK